MRNISKQAGFTAVELLITLFVAAGFLVASYQLFNLIIKDGGSTRSESRAGNVAYDYMRRYISTATSPCTVQDPLTNSAITVDGLVDATVSVDITCPVSYSISTVSEIEVTVKYNVPEQTVKYSTFTIGSSSSDNEVTNGLIGWWKLNGNTAPSIGTVTGTLMGPPTLTTGQNTSPNSAYNFSGSTAFIALTGTEDTLPAKDAPRSLCAWAKPSSVATGLRYIAAYGSSSNDKGALIGMNGTSAIAGSMGTNATVTSVWAVNIWHHICITFNGSSSTVLYIDGTSRSTTSQTWDTDVSDLYIGRNSGGTANQWLGAIDDVRIYNRAISAAEALSLFNQGAR